MTTVVKDGFVKCGDISLFQFKSEQQNFEQQTQDTTCFTNASKTLDRIFRTGGIYMHNKDKCPNLTSS